jgi:hypothetical protein
MLIPLVEVETQDHHQIMPLIMQRLAQQIQVVAVAELLLQEVEVQHQEMVVKVVQVLSL